MFQKIIKTTRRSWYKNNLAFQTTMSKAVRVMNSMVTEEIIGGYASKIVEQVQEAEQLKFKISNKIRSMKPLFYFKEHAVQRDRK